MKKVLQHRPSPSMVVALVALVVATAGVTYAAIPDGTGVIHACYAKNGSLRVIDTQASPPQACKENEASLDWQKEGAPGTGDRVVSNLVRLSVGESKTVVQKSPFTITGRCVDLGSGRFQAGFEFRSTEADTVYSSGVPIPANTPRAFNLIAGTTEAWEATLAHVVAPSGATWAISVSAGVHTYGSDCAVAATAAG